MRGRPAGAGKATPQQSATSTFPLGPAAFKRQPGVTSQATNAAVVSPSHGREHPGGPARPPRHGASPPGPAGRARTVCGHDFKAGVHLHHGAFVEHVGCVQRLQWPQDLPLYCQLPPGRLRVRLRGRPGDLAPLPRNSLASPGAPRTPRRTPLDATSSARCVTSRTDAAAEAAGGLPTAWRAPWLTWVRMASWVTMVPAGLRPDGYCGRCTRRLPACNTQPRAPCAWQCPPGGRRAHRQQADGSCC